MTLNESQTKIAKTTEGMLVADAGPGTGKTYTVVHRCINILLRKDMGPKDLIMLTFTRNAAAEMKERVQAEVAKLRSGNDITEADFKHVSKLVKETYIGTFDSFCLNVVKQSPGYISRFFKFDEELSRSADITENDSLNHLHFARFLDRFLHTRGEEFGDLAALAAEKPNAVYDLLNRLMSRGILPYRRSSIGTLPWFGGNDGKDLLGDPDTVRRLLDAFPGFNDDGKKFKGRSGLEGFDLFADPPSSEMLDAAAYDDRTALIDMIHEIYYDYLHRCVIDGHLTFGVVATFAFVILYSDSRARESFRTRYLIVDEFQDTNTNQMMISLMLLKEPNLCVVGDWKQGIYGFRFVSIENMTRFEDRVKDLTAFLNDDIERVTVRPAEILKFPLLENYRSSQLIIDRAYESLLIPGSEETLDLDALRADITPIVSKREDIGERTAFECVKCENKEAEIDEVLRRILNYVNSDDYLIAEDGKTRRPRYGDIAILCRTVPVSLKIFEACSEHRIPAFLQGDVNVMASREGKMLLAWLKYISNDSDMWGIVPILADLGYSELDIERLRYWNKETKDEPVLQELRAFKTMLRSKRRRITELISDIFSFYGWDNDNTQAITAILSSSHRNSLMTISDLIRIIESDIATNAKHDVDGLPLSNAVIIQTVHKSKGLEYPIVILPRMDSKTFPLVVNDDSTFVFSDTMGIRCKEEVIGFGGEKSLTESWKTDAVIKSEVQDYSEERRLLFVGISRAKQYVTMIAGKTPSVFYKYYQGRYGEVEGGTEPIPVLTAAEEELIDRPAVAPIRPRRKNIPVHGLMHLDKSGYRAETESDEFNKKGMQYGTDVHKLAEMLVRGKTLEDRLFKEYPQLNMARDIITELGAKGAELTAEKECSLPLNNLNATVRGVIDMFAEFPDRIEVHDWKTDGEPVYVDEYKLQLTVYAMVLAHMKNKPVECHIDWLTQGRSEVFAPLSADIVTARAKEFLSAAVKSQDASEEEDTL